MKCDRIKKKLSALLDHQLSGREAFIVNEHLKECGSCRRAQEELAELHGILARIPDIEVPFHFYARLMPSLASRPVAGLSLIGKLRWAVLLAATAVAMITSLAIGNYMGMRLYGIIAGNSGPGSESVEILDFALNSYPQGSLSDVYQNVMNGAENE